MNYHRASHPGTAKKPVYNHKKEQRKRIKVAQTEKSTRSKIHQKVKRSINEDSDDRLVVSVSSMLQSKQRLQTRNLQ